MNYMRKGHEGVEGRSRCWLPRHTHCLWSSMERIGEEIRGEQERKERMEEDIGERGRGYQANQCILLQLVSRQASHYQTSLAVIQTPMNQHEQRRREK